MSKPVLQGLRVIDFGQHIAGPMTSMILSDYGADVIHIDPIGGPVWKNEEANAILMRGKRNICLDLKDPKDREIALKLLQTADIAVENFRPGVMKRLGLSYEDIKEVNPSLIYVSQPGFSHDDPRRDLRGWEGIVSCEAGIYQALHAKTQDVENNSTIFNGLPLASIFSAAIAAHSIIAALIVREKTGRGQWIESSLYDACFELEGSCGTKPRAKGGQPGTPGRKHIEYDFHRLLSQFPCKDGRYVKHSPPVKGAMRMIPDLIPDHFFDSEELRTPEIDTYFAKMMQTKTSLEWEKFAQEKYGAGIVKVHTTKEWLHDEHARESETSVYVYDPILKDTLQTGVPVKLPGLEAEIRGRHLPDEDREEILKELETCQKKSFELKDLKEEIHPLDGIRIVDFCQVLAGPIGGKILAEYGADVIKINPPKSMTAIACHELVNNGKLTALLDLKDEEDRKTIDGILKQCDVFQCNFALDVYKRLGIDENRLKELNPSIIISRLNLHSVGGWREFERGHEELGESISGIGTRYSASMKAGRLPIVICDHLSGQFSALGVLLSVYHRMKTGESPMPHASLSRTGTLAQIPYCIDYFDKKWNEPKGPEAHGWNRFDRMYHTSDADVFLYMKDRFERMKDVKGFEDIDPFEEASEKEYEDRISKMECQDFLERLKEAGIEARRHRNFFMETMEEEYAKHAGLSVKNDHIGIGTFREISCKTNRMTLTPPKAARPVSEPGYDTQYVRETILSGHWPTIKDLDR